MATSGPSAIARGWRRDRDRFKAERDEARGLLEDEQEAVDSSIANLEQCTTEPDDHCNDVTRVHDRLLRQREDLDAYLRRVE